MAEEKTVTVARALEAYKDFFLLLPPELQKEILNTEGFRQWAIKYKDILA